jgi:hypothetical protein
VTSDIRRSTKVVHDEGRARTYFDVQNRKTFASLRTKAVPAAVSVPR